MILSVPSISLPPFAAWTPDQFRKRRDVDAIVSARLDGT
jgi:hypothetical protein